MSDNIVPFRTSSSARTSSGGEMYDLLSKIDELEELLETLDEFGITTRAELVDMISRLEADAALRDAGKPPHR
ncbi:MAG: hypothetical protein AVDCRST_MAG87-3026 [uncultured Thermomicrobiales bacterium]|uniref:Uncharacterized protein n=1 Tax=uncultured Thermomicrobiales bacterium TaxID=1645740 RepID=A0A6J4VJH6_9BACT|nr:MAG: hypothetical protein AVDCRST_MAG87-3026 [uncultured Thermomicrobiales bacterium]